MGLKTAHYNIYEQPVVYKKRNSLNIEMKNKTLKEISKYVNKLEKVHINVPKLHQSSNPFPLIPWENDTNRLNITMGIIKSVLITLLIIAVATVSIGIVIWMANKKLKSFQSRYEPEAPLSSGESTSIASPSAPPESPETKHRDNYEGTIGAKRIYPLLEIQNEHVSPTFVFNAAKKANAETNTEYDKKENETDQPANK